MIVYFKFDVFELSTISRVLPTMIQCRREVPRNAYLGTFELRSLDTLEYV